MSKCYSNIKKDLTALLTCFPIAGACFLCYSSWNHINKLKTGRYHSACQWVITMTQCQTLYGHGLLTRGIVTPICQLIHTIPRGIRG